VRDLPGKSLVAGMAIRALRRFRPRPDLTFFLGQHGRLGNQLFQIAGTYALASDLGVGVLLRKDWPYRPYFSVPDDWFAGRVAVLRCRKSMDHATQIPPEWREYLQDLALWGRRADDIRLLLQPSPYALERAEARHTDLLALPSKTAVHVRRGDYLRSDMPQAPCPVRYYEEAAELVLASDPDTQILVFSDDMEWCRRELPVRDAIYVEGNPDWLDLTLMTRCEHHICANSTFSWWGAFLSGDPNPIVPWLVGSLPESFRHIHPPEWRELVLEQ
jgi:hypothetical protein